MFKIDFAAVLSAVIKVVDEAGVRVPAETVVAALVEAGVEFPADCDPVLLVKVIVSASKDLDVRQGRTGGVGRREWFKGGKSTVEPDSPIARLAKRIREEHGSSLPKGEEREAAKRAANAYFAALAAGEVTAMPLAEVLARFGGE